MRIFRLHNICEKAVVQIKNDAVEYSVIRTATPGESEEQKQMKRETYKGGRAIATLHFVSSGLSQTAACEVVIYSLRMWKCSAATIRGALSLNSNVNSRKKPI